MLSEFFVTFMLPRRVRRDPRIARGLIRLFWRPWRVIARQLSASSADTFLGLFGPLALLSELLTWTVGLILGFAPFTPAQLRKAAPILARVCRRM